MDFLPKFIDKTLKLIEVERLTEIEEAEKLREGVSEVTWKLKDYVFANFELRASHLVLEDELSSNYSILNIPFFLQTDFLQVISSDSFQRKLHQN